MKAQALMVGDWVIVQQNPVNHLRVVAITNDYIEVADENNHGGLEEYPPSALHGIPITPEILEKNGFEYENNVGYVYDNYEGIIIAYSTFISRLRIIKDLNILYDSQDYADIYMHTIQHALRLCGIEKQLTV